MLIIHTSILFFRKHSSFPFPRLRNEFSFSFLILLIQLVSPFQSNVAFGQCKAVLVENDSPANASVEARASWTEFQYPGTLSTPTNSGEPPQGGVLVMNPTGGGASIWQQEFLYNFSFSFNAGEGLSDWRIDFNRDGDYNGAGERVYSVDEELVNKGFSFLRIFAQASDNFQILNTISIRNLIINGVASGDIYAFGPNIMDLNYSGLGGSLNDISVTGSLAFSNMTSFVSNSFPVFKIQLISPVERSLCELPVISHPTGTYDGQQTISISYPDSSASIYYTTSGNMPVIGTAFTILYTEPLVVNATTTIRTMAVKTGFPNSPVAVSFLSITNPPAPVITPVISPGTGSYNNPQEVSLTCGTEGATIYYTTTGNVPVPGTAFTKIYSVPFVVNFSTQIRAIALKDSMLISPEAISNITITSPPSVVAKPGISPGSGTHFAPQAITITCATPGSTIYYTTNGNVPLLSPWPNSFTRIYSGPFTVTSRGRITIRAMAIAAGQLNSQVAVANLLLVNPGSRQAVDEEELEAVQQDIQVYPNPSEGSFFIQLPKEEVGYRSYSVWSVDGKEVCSGNLETGQTGSIDLSLQKSGLYHLRIRTESGLKTMRLSKF